MAKRKKMRKEEFWEQAQRDLKQEDVARKSFLFAIKVMEDPKAEYERKRIAKIMIRDFLKFRSITTKALRVRIRAATLDKN